MPDLSLPPGKAAAILREFPETGPAWVEAFPENLARCCEQWNLRVTGVATGGLSINHVFFCERDGKPVVLKIGHPHPEQITEMIALSVYDGRGINRAIAEDRVRGALLLERVVPGDQFRALTVNRSSTPLSVFRTLPIRMDGVEGLPTYRQWIERAIAEYEQHDGVDGYKDHLDAITELFADLEDRFPGQWLLHGDLHHENILRLGEDEWLAIDPKGVIGPRAMECGRFMHNVMEDETGRPVEESSPIEIATILNKRADWMSEVMAMSRRDVFIATYIDVALATLWTINSDPTGDHTFPHVRHVARVFHDL